jgi:hypothetical protein
MSEDRMNKPGIPGQSQAGRKARGPAGQERRATRRFDISKSETWISTIPRFSLLDVSPSGAGLVSQYPVRSGEMIRISVKGGPSADALVVYCRLGEVADTPLINNFHVGCRFISRKEADDLTNRIEYQLASILG